MRRGNAAVHHHDYQISQAQLEARVPGDTQDAAFAPEPRIDFMDTDCQRSRRLP
jgi:hypothetical protein